MKYILAVDQSTSSTKVTLFNERMEAVRSIRRAHRQIYPRPSWVEHDAEEIWRNTASLLAEAAEGIAPGDVAGIGLANQRETTVVWERDTGRPVCNAVVWQDTRAKYITDPIQPYSDRIFALSGLRPSPYYSAAKLAAILAEESARMEAAKAGKLCFGTVDSFLLYRLTGGRSFYTDTTNACRTQLFDIGRMCWSEELAGYFGIPMAMLADAVLPADSAFGTVSAIPALSGVPVTAMLGDSHASFFGHGCTEAGLVKTSFGTGSSVMMNIGSSPVWSGKGLATSIGFSRGGKTCYVLEGNITCSADTLIWVKDYLHLIDDLGELDEAGTVGSTDGVYLVPAFAGLGAPWFNEDARAMICGMSRGTTRAHILRAALASIAHQNADVLDAMAADTGIPISRVRADGGGCSNRLLMQMQSDLIPCEIAVSSEKDITLRGIGLMAGISAGLFAPDAFEAASRTVYSPAMSEEERKLERAGWMNAVRRCM